MDLNKLVPYDGVKIHLLSDARSELAATIIFELGTESNSQVFDKLWINIKFIS